VRGDGRETTMNSYLDKKMERRFGRISRLSFATLKAPKTTHRVEILLDIIDNLEQARTNASQLDD
jgi:hypothetical protein